ncbi:MAG: hypothetical protein HC800_12380 [Phormidesmis sp. RL_2_1]|nr:hypothetical protein [Phormidesmis sp. RL_2_1]
MYCLVTRPVENPPAEGEPPAEDEPLAEGEPLAEDEPLAEGEPLAEEEGIDLAEEEYLVIPYLTAINVKTGQEQELIEMPPNLKLQ